MPKLIVSDLHFHGWSQFSSTNEDGINSRLQHILDALNEAIDHLLKEGGDEVVLAGDTFHVRGAVAPSVLNPVLDLFGRRISEDGIRVYAIPGNHDLEGNESERVGNAVAALEKVGVEVAHEPMIVGGMCLFPWRSKIPDLLADMKCAADEIFNEDEDARPIAVIHAPVDGVLPYIPSHGLTGKDLGQFGYDSIFCGHYHNHIEVEAGVYSVGALTHQTFSDIGSLAGYLLVWEDGRVKHFETTAPKFVDVTGDEDPDEFKKMIAGNFVRVKCEINSADEMNEIRKDLEKLKPAGVVIHPVKKTTVTRATASKAGASSLEASISAYVKDQELDANVERMCLDVLAEARGGE